ncbi:exonuclease [Natronococcus sp. A-GB1]|uniref:exonuclease n=1 Tax=Natronococcus sp. A-GB1 TaxID=3037648 RepID=UPI00241F06BB|nr:exonuclease [Natronococcus sp. A-GB1]MDG5762021.1 exonuclease [Natronococcus sp. A-GB1]
MSTEGRTAEATPAPLESAGFVRLVSSADGDALAATGLLARAIRERGTPFQVTVGRTVTERTERATIGEPETDDATIVVGSADADLEAIRLAATDRAATLEAAELVRELGEAPDPVLALAGLVAAGSEPGAGESEWVLETARDRGLVGRRPGVAVPTADPVDGLAHSTRVRAPWSGDPDAVRDALSGLELPEPDALEASDHRAIGSLVALDAVGAEDTVEASARSIGRALKPYATPEGPFATVGGYADVLAATARTEPGTGVALAMGHGVDRAALETWRTHGRRAHAALDSASGSRHDGLFVLGIEDGPVETVAEIAVAYRSPEPTVLVVGDGEAALATRTGESLGSTVEAIARALEDDVDGLEYDDGRRRGYLRYDPETDDSTIIATTREFR